MITMKITWNSHGVKAEMEYESIPEGSTIENLKSAVMSYACEGYDEHGGVGQEISPEVALTPLVIAMDENGKPVARGDILGQPWAMNLISTVFPPKA